MTTALLVIDMQMHMADRTAAGRPRCNPDAETHVASLIALLGFDLPAHDGGRIDPETALRVTLATLGSDFARVVTTSQVAGLL